MAKNRNPIKQWFITFPQSGTVSRQDFYEVITELGELQYCLVAQEAHKDGTPHLHAVVQLVEPITFKHIKDTLSKYYPTASKRLDYKPCRSLKASISYCQKEDLNPFIIGEYKNSRGCSEAHRQKLIEADLDELSKNPPAPEYNQDTDVLEGTAMKEMLENLTMLLQNPDPSDFEIAEISHLKNLFSKY